MDETIAELHARQEIRDLISQYCRGVDRADYDLVRAVYAEEGVDHHTGFSGPADEYVEWLKLRTSGFTGMMHNVGTHTASISGDEATAETYGTAHHWGAPSDDPTVNFTSGFRYLDRLRRTPEGWRIVERVAVREWTRSDAGVLRTPEGRGPRGVRGAMDPLYTEGFATHTDDVRIATELKQQYFDAVDQKNWENLRHVFIPNAKFGGFRFGLSEGVEELIQMLNHKLTPAQSFHEGSNPKVARLDDSTIRVVWHMCDTLSWPTDHPSMSSPEIPGMNGLRGEGYYEDEIVRTAEGWRIGQSRHSRSRGEAVTDATGHPLQLGSQERDPLWVRPKRS